jgi:RNA polymerase sigma factor (TIGR02999 family)
MSDPAPRAVTQLLQDLTAGDDRAAESLLPLVYTELRRLAKSRMAKLPPGQTLQPTALVHEAYLRLVGSEDPGWDGRAHFFGAAARAMRDIIVDQARRKAAVAGASTRMSSRCRSNRRRRICWRLTRRFSTWSGTTRARDRS